MEKNKARLLAHQTSTYFHTRRVSIRLNCVHNPTLRVAVPVIYSHDIVCLFVFYKSTRFACGDGRSTSRTLRMCVRAHLTHVMFRCWYNRNMHDTTRNEPNPKSRFINRKARTHRTHHDIHTSDYESSRQKSVNKSMVHQSYFLHLVLLLYIFLVFRFCWLYILRVFFVFFVVNEGVKKETVPPSLLTRAVSRHDLSQQLVTSRTNS